MTQIKYIYYLDTPDGKSYEAYTLRQLAEESGLSEGMMRVWVQKGISKQYADKGYVFETEDFQRREYIIKDCGKVYRGGTVSELARNAGISDSKARSILESKRTIWETEEAYTIDYLTNQIKEPGEGWRDITPEDWDRMNEEE